MKKKLKWREKISRYRRLMERTTICGRKELRCFWGLKNAILLRRVRRSRRRPSWSGRRGLPIVTLTRDRPKYYVERHSASTGPHTVGRLATRCPHVITACLQYSQGHILIVRYGRIRQDSFCHVWCCCAARLSMLVFLTVSRGPPASYTNRLIFPTKHTMYRRACHESNFCLARVTPDAMVLARFLMVWAPRPTHCYTDPQQA
jgi:hypothetical protein